MTSTLLKVFGPAVLLGAMALGSTGCSKSETEVKKAEILYEEAQKQVKADSIEYLEYNPHALFYKAKLDSITRAKDVFVEKNITKNKQEIDYNEYQKIRNQIKCMDNEILELRYLSNIADGGKFIHSKSIRHLAYENLLNQRMIEKLKNNKYFKESIENILDSIREQSSQAQE